MFHDHPQLSNEYLDVFYGNTDSTPRNRVDEKVLGIARGVTHELFEGKNC